MFCPKCGSPNDDAAKFCVSCGTALALTGKATPIAPAQSEEPADEEEYYKAVVGAKNQDYYLDHFSRFDDEGKISPTWNWPAFLVTFYWLLYRKMWRGAAIYIAVPIILLLLFWAVGAVAGSAVGFVVTLGSFAYVVAVFVAIPLYANGLYYLQCQKAIAAVRSTTNGTQEQLAELAGIGGTSHAAYRSILAINIVAVIGVLIAIAIPAYQDSAARARVAEALTVGRDATEYADNYYSQYRSIPSNLDAADFMSALPPSVKAVSIDNQAGTITITMTGGKAIDGKSLNFIASNTGGDRLRWTCMSEQIQDRYLPQECRQGR